MKRLSSIMLAAVGLSLLTWFCFLRLPRAVPASGRSADAFCQHLLNDKSHREALSWIRESRNGNVRTIGEQDPDDSLRIVRQLYDQGAQKVWAVDLEKYAEGESTNALVLELPEKPELRRQLFTLEARCASSGGFDPVGDDGQHYMFLYKFKTGLQL